MTGLMLIGIIVAAALVAIVIIDIRLAYTGGFPATLSYWIMITSVQYPIIPTLIAFACGVLYGHFEWSQQLNVVMQCPVSK